MARGGDMAGGGPMESAGRPVQSLIALLNDPRRLAELGPTEEEVLADLMWPVSRERSE
jgi:hypothetical protein